MADGKTDLSGLDLSRQQLLFGTRTLAELISTDLTRLQLKGPVTMTELARRQAIQATLAADEVSRTTETAHVEKVEPPSLHAIATARRLQRR